MAYSDKLAKALTEKTLRDGKLVSQPVEELSQVLKLSVRESYIPVKRTTGIRTSITQLAKVSETTNKSSKAISESVTNLTELSKGILKSYVKKAENSKLDLGDKYLEAKPGSKEDTDSWKKPGKRQDGIDKAARKVAESGPISTNKLANALMERKAIQEAFVNARDKATDGIGLHTKQNAYNLHKVTNQSDKLFDFYEPKNGDKKQGFVHSVSPDSYKVREIGDDGEVNQKGPLHTFKYRDW